MAQESDAEAEDGADSRRRGLDAVYRAHAPGLARFLRYRFRGAVDTEDMVQDIFTRLAGSKSFSQARDPQAYISRVLRNLLIDRKRRLDNRPIIMPLDMVSEPPVEPDQAHWIELTQMRGRYRAAVEALPPRTKEVFLLHRAEEQPVQTIAERLSISSRTVEWHLAQAILRISEALESE